MKAKEKILIAATDLFHNQGYNSTGINQIIEESGIAKGSFYYNFDSKEDLCVSFLNRRHDFWFDKLKKYIANNKTDQHRVLKAFDFLTVMNKKEKFRGCSFLNILSEISGDNQLILSIIQNHKSDLRHFISSMIEEETLVDHIYLLFEGALIESQLFKNHWPVERAKEIVKKIIE